METPPPTVPLDGRDGGKEDADHENPAEVLPEGVAGRDREFRKTVGKGTGGNLGPGSRGDVLSETSYLGVGYRKIEEIK